MAMNGKVISVIGKKVYNLKKKILKKRIGSKKGVRLFTSTSHATHFSHLSCSLTQTKSKPRAN